MAAALSKIHVPAHPAVIAGIERHDDAGVYRLADDLALVQTLDFFAPIVDDPFTFGRIAATNSLSDVWAMGGQPICAMNIVCFPADTLSPDVLGEILNGGLETMTRAEVALVGGHSVTDRELKYGLAVTGTVHPDHVLKNLGAQPGDRLVLTKPIGTGIIGTAIKKQTASAEAAQAAIESMLALNRWPREILPSPHIHACTDITGFGFLGHASEMVNDSPVGFVVDARAVPLLPEALALNDRGVRPGGLKRNREYFAPWVRIETDSADSAAPPAGVVDVLFDPQTSGGLLIAVAADFAETLVAAFRNAGRSAAQIVGEVVAEHPGIIRVR